MLNKIIATFLLTIAINANALSISDQEIASLSFNMVTDPFTDTAGGSEFKVYGMGTAINNGFLYVVVQANLPIGGAISNDSYTNSTLLSPGDLYLNVGGTFQSGTGVSYGIATTSHGNVVQQAYHDTWLNVNAGSLYSGVTFANGTYEQYQYNLGYVVPDDGDGNTSLNSYPTLIRQGTLQSGDVSGVRYRNRLMAGSYAYEILYKVSLSAIGVTDQTTIQAFWTMECGNDGVETVFRTPSIPEPTTVGLLLFGLTGVISRRKNII